MLNRQLEQLHIQLELYCTIFLFCSILFCLCTNEVNKSLNQLWLAAVEFQAQGSVWIEIYVLWMCIYKCVCLCPPVCVGHCVSFCVCVCLSTVWPMCVGCMCLGMCTWIFVCVCVSVYLLCICLSVTLRSYIIPPKSKAFASLQHAQ